MVEYSYHLQVTIEIAVEKIAKHFTCYCGTIYFCAIFVCDSR